MEEIWKDIKGYEGSYQVSNGGIVKSLARTIIVGKRHRGIKKLPEIIMKLTKDGCGYFRVILTKNGKGRAHSVSHLVWDHFGNGEPIPIGMHVDHIREHDKANNSINNLQLLTLRENVSKSIKNTSRSSMFVGVCKRGRRWQANIRLGGKSFTIGRFDTEECASSEYHRVLCVYEQTGLVDIIPQPKKNMYSSFPGVSFDKNQKRFCTEKMVGGKRFHMGSYKTEGEAINAVKKFMGEIH